MAFEKLTNADLVREARDRMSQVASLMDQGKSRLDELAKRIAVSPPPPAPVPASPIDTGMARAPAQTDILIQDVPAVDFKVNPADWTDAAPVPPSAAPDVVGAFRLTSAVTHMSNEDSLAFPGNQRPGNHHHTYWGNPVSNSATTYENLVTQGVGSGEGGALNRTTKWMGSLLTGDMRVVVPDYITEYYKQLPAADGAWFKAQSAAEQARINAHRPHIIDAAGKDTGRFAKTVPLPQSLRYIIGNILPPEYGTTVTWTLYDAAMAVQIAESVTLSDLLAKMTQGTTYNLIMTVSTPQGWDGKRVRASDHHSHMAHPQWNGALGCFTMPETHPFLLPGILVRPKWRITPEAGDPKKLHFSSDLLSPGDTMHMEYMEGWHRPTIEAWHQGCIDGMLNSVSGNMGNGRILRRPPCFTFEVKNNVITPDANGNARLVDADGVRLVE